MQKTNFHTHTARCGHASGTDEQYVLSAIRGSYRVLGFSDHTPWPYASSYVAGMRMPLSALGDYLNSVRSLREKYAGRIEIRIGLECEYFDDYMPWLRGMIRRERLDYVIFGNHFYRTDERYPYFGHHTHTAEMLARYAESTVRGIRSGIYACLAHPDLFMRSYPVFDARCERVSRLICREAALSGLLLEYNVSMIAYNEAHGVEGVPHPAFWRIAAEEGCTAIVGLDAHDNRDLETGVYYDRGKRELALLGIRTTDTLPFSEYGRSGVLSPVTRKAL